MNSDFRSSSEFARAYSFYAKLLGSGGHVFHARALCGDGESDHPHFIGQSFESGRRASRSFWLGGILVDDDVRRRPATGRSRATPIGA
jgi:hypothetical protein